MFDRNDMVRPRILLTGFNGQVGWELLQSLQLIGDIVPTGMSDEAGVRNLQTLDLADADQILKVMNEVRPHIVINSAAYTAVDRAEDEEDLATSINARGPAVLAEAAKQLQCPMIHFSTDYVYAGEGNQIQDEQTPTSPINAYGRSKLIGDLAVQEMNPAHVILRTSWVYGQTGHNFVKTMLQLGAEREELQVVNDQWGAPTSARTLADIVTAIIHQSLASPWDFFTEHHGIFHAVNGGVTNWHEYAVQIFEMARQHGASLVVKHVEPVSSDVFPTKAKRPHNSRLSCDKLQRTFGLRPANWAEALNDGFLGFYFPRGER